MSDTRERVYIGGAVGLWPATDHNGIVHWTWIQANNLEITKQGFSWATTLCMSSALACKEMRRMTCLFCAAKDSPIQPFEEMP